MREIEQSFYTCLICSSFLLLLIALFNQAKMEEQLFCMISNKYSVLKCYFLADRNYPENILNFFSSLILRKMNFLKEYPSLYQFLLRKSCQYLFREISFFIDFKS